MKYISSIGTKTPRGRRVTNQHGRSGHWQLSKRVPTKEKDDMSGKMNNFYVNWDYFN